MTDDVELRVGADTSDALAKPAHALHPATRASLWRFGYLALCVLTHCVNVRYMFLHDRASRF
jgi:hypothetical protein